MIAAENLYLLLTALAAQGLNLWCIQSDLIGLTDGKATYDTISGTVDVLNVTYCNPSRVTGTDTITATSISTELESSTTVQRIGLKFSSIVASDLLTIETSQDGVTWVTLLTDTRSNWTTETWYWFAIDPQHTALHFRASTNYASITEEFYLARVISDLPVVQWSRDTWAVIPNKAQKGRPVTNYYLERLLTPRLTLWPVPNNDYDHLQVFVQRQIQDVGSLTQHLEVPERWLDPVIWLLAERLAFELPEVEASLIPLLTARAQQALAAVSIGETDGAPITLTPSIRVYTA
jgi:hypothetical protein